MSLRNPPRARFEALTTSIAKDLSSEFDGPMDLDAAPREFLIKMEATGEFGEPEFAAEKCLDSFSVEYCRDVECISMLATDCQDSWNEIVGKREISQRCALGRRSILTCFVSVNGTSSTACPLPGSSSTS